MSHIRRGGGFLLKHLSQNDTGGERVPDIAPGSGQAAPALVNRPPRFYWWASEGVWRYPMLRYKRPKNTIIVI